jgi:NADH-quinone oxidoreductase subunit H
MILTNTTNYFAKFIEYLSGAEGLNLGFAGEILAYVVIAALYLAFFAVAGLMLVYMERRIAAFFQLRLGPNRVGPWGLLQTIADALKLVAKEITGTDKKDGLLYHTAYYLVIVAAWVSLSVVSFAPGVQAFNVNIGVFFISAVSSVGVLGLIFGGWGSNNKYSLLGAMRSGLQMISYELSAGLAMLTIILMVGSLNVDSIIEAQQSNIFLIQGHIPALIAFAIFIIAGTAESNRTPFDLPEGEAELGAGFHSEYSGMGFAYFFLAEFINMFIIASLTATLFLGGWLAPFGITDSLPWQPLWGLIWFFVKVLGVIFLMMWFRWTFPRLRIDQLLTLEWKYLLPMALVNIVLMALVVYFDLLIKF